MNLPRLFFCAALLGPTIGFAATTATPPAAPTTTPPKAPAATPPPSYDPTKPGSVAPAAEPKPAEQKVSEPKADEPKSPEPASVVEEAPILLPPASASPFKRIGPIPVASKTKSFIWQVRSPSNTVYVFGTIHVGKKSFYPLPSQVESALDNAVKLVVEADVSDQSGAGDVTSLVEYKSPDTLDRHIPMPLFERLKAQLTRLRVPVSAVQPMKPFVAGGFLSVVEFSRLGYDMNLGVDAYLTSRAKTAHIPIEELESARAQLELLSNMPQELQEAFLDNSIATLETGRAGEQVTGMVNAWQTGDTKLMAEVTLEVNKGMRKGKELDEVLLYSRHPNMVKKIEGYLAGNEITFIAVGSLHLVGPRGVIESLKAKGYEVTQK
ncbi:MAG: TraB/GumN family protein [Betaproteobacteria bacterium]